MEFLDPKKHRAHLIRLFTGYVLIAAALVLTTIILLYQAYGFGIKNGEVIQKGLIFVSSNPSGADIYVNGQRHEERTNSRLLMEAGQYTFEVKRDGYRPWKRAINIEGGVVARFDYPFLFAKDLKAEPVKTYEIQPSIVTQSPNRRWLFVQASSDFRQFEVFDLSKSDKAPVAFVLPEDISRLPAGTHSWKLIDWAKDQSHLLMQHSVEAAGKISSEYILIDREDAAQSVNLTTALGTHPTKLELMDKAYDKYFVYDGSGKTLSTATLSNPQPELLIEDVLSFKTHGDDTVLYATDRDAAEGKVQIRLRYGDRDEAVRQVAAQSTYVLDVARYDGRWYVVAGASSENRVYVYRNPQQALAAQEESSLAAPLVPVQVLKVTNPQHLSFSQNARYVMIQNGAQFAVYDAETDRGYRYESSKPMDAPQAHATWMDGHRLQYVSGGKIFVFDFDMTNQAVLVGQLPTYAPAYDPDFKVLYTLTNVPADPANNAPASFSLQAAQLRTPADR